MNSISSAVLTDDTFAGLVVPHDMALDRELWRWAPEGVSLLFTRTPFTPLPVNVEMAEVVSDLAMIEHGVRDLQAVAPSAYAYGCTSGSFVHGVLGEREIVAAMRQAGAPVAVTTSGALVAALAQLGARRVAVATPYDATITARLVAFLQAANIEVTGSADLGLTGDVWKVPYAATTELVHRADSPEAEAVVISCTNLATYDVIASLELELGKPVVSANQATMWALLAALGKSAVGPGQRLLAAASRS